jgi:hypothetical protein
MRIFANRLRGAESAALPRLRHYHGCDTISATFSAACKNKRPFLFQETACSRNGL